MLIKLLSLTLLLVLMGCDGLSVNYDYDHEVDFSKLKTYIWKNSDPRTDALVKNAIMQKRMKMAIDSVLGAKGFTLIKDSTADADFAVITFAKVKEIVSVVDNRTTTGVSVGVGAPMGYGYDAPVGYNYGWYHPWYPSTVGVAVGGSTSGSIDIESQDEGTLFIDIIDLSEKQLAWRGIAKKMIEEFDGIEKRIAASNLIVSKVLENFPPQSSEKK